LLLICISYCASSFGTIAQTLRLEIEPQWNGHLLKLGRDLVTADGEVLSFSRIDALLSELALQRADGTWIESESWFAHLNTEQSTLSASADGLPPVEFKTIRFRVGLNEKTDSANPLQWAADHPLNPEVCGMHWGWQSGYVFMAIEGHSGREKLNGFSYHLARASEPMMVEVPVSFSGRQPATVRLAIDLAKILDNGAVLREASSTHSRDDDELARRLKRAVSKAFAVESVRADSYQKLEIAGANNAAPGAAFGTPYRLNISERLPKVSLPADNPITEEGVALGRRIFHEVRLSRNNSQSCATCHDQKRAFTDGDRVSVGSEGQVGKRNAMALVNLAWSREFFWDGRAKSLREQVLMPIQDAHEMNESLERVVSKLEKESAYRESFERAFGAHEITPDRIARALEQFLLTLVSQESKFDRAARRLTELTAEEKRGLKLFVTEFDPARNLRGADCFHCHGGNLFSNQQFLNNGLAPRSGDIGRMEVTGQESDRGKFKVPTLRNVALTAPYMHDGRFATLEEVVDHYNGPLHRSPTLDPNLAKHPTEGLQLSAADKAALVSFLKTLTDEGFASGAMKQNQFSKNQ
jgi:cytochrome c peroxidase